jgi:hypothetical protein
VDWKRNVKENSRGLFNVRSEHFPGWKEETREKNLVSLVSDSAASAAAYGTDQFENERKSFVQWLRGLKHELSSRAQTLGSFN